MTGQDFQDKLNAIVLDLQTAGKGQTVNIAMRGLNGAVSVFPLSSSVGGVVSQAQLAAINGFLADNSILDAANSYADARPIIDAPLAAFKAALQPHTALSEAATLARKNFNDALAADASYQAAKTTLDNARTDADYISSVAAYKESYVSENFGNLSDAKGKYIA